ncbi:hypothetical protein Q9Q99_08740 [Curtobacterium flaccumfaciens]|nr:hypothetical protein Q9Q99_08740 [Curtobacterium flaccumfaciens]
MITYAIALCTWRNGNGHGYHWYVLSRPVTTWMIDADTSTTIDSRSSRCTTPRTGGTCTRAGITVLSFASSSGMIAMPVVMCRPCVNWYSCVGRVGEPHPAERFLQQVAVDPGAEADQERDAEQASEHHRRAGVAVGGRQSCSSVVQQTLDAG